MISVVVVADSGSGLRRLSELLDELPEVHIARYCSGRAPVGASVAAVAPDVVLVDEMRWPRMTVLRIAEISACGPARVILCASRLEAGWLAEALHAGADALVPQSAGAATLRLVMGEVVLSDAVEIPRDQAAQAA